MKRIVVCDDDKIFVEQFVKQIQKYFVERNLEVCIEQYYSAENLLLSNYK